MKDALYIAAKAPRAGLVKTRLGRIVGHENAVALYRAFLRDLAARFAEAPFGCRWYVTPPDAWPEISPLAGPLGNGTRPLLQVGDDWAERQQNLFRGAAARGEGRVVLIASDSPHLTVEVVARAFRELDRQDLVLGPTYDGGYHLVGMRGSHEVLGGVPMSTDTALEQVLARARRAGLSVGLVEATFDVDEAKDLGRLRRVVRERPDLPATRAVLEGLGMPETFGKADPKPGASDRSSVAPWTPEGVILDERLVTHRPAGTRKVPDER